MDDRTMSTLDASGVALAAIQGLYGMLKERDAEIASLKAKLAEIMARLERTASRAKYAAQER
jgi:hypothetical protein